MGKADMRSHDSRAHCLAVGRCGRKSSHDPPYVTRPSLPVPVRVRPVPVPGGLDDRPQVRVLRLPSPAPAGPCPTRRPAPAGRPAAAGLPSPRSACRSPPRAVRITSRTLYPRADAEVVLHPLARLELLQRQQVGLGQVVHVDVVADAGAVGRRVVGAEDLDVRPLARARPGCTSGIRCVSGSWSSPMVPSGAAPEALKYRRAAYPSRRPRRSRPASARPPAWCCRRG